MLNLDLNLSLRSRILASAEKSVQGALNLRYWKRLPASRPASRLIFRAVDDGRRSGWIPGRISRWSHDVTGGIGVVMVGRLSSHHGASGLSRVLSQRVLSLLRHTTQTCHEQHADKNGY
jgi:hypothetical protein